MLGLFFSILAGAMMSIQGVFNSRVTEKVGINETNIIVQGTAFVAALIAFFIWGKGNLKNIGSVNKLYLLGGIIGVVITFSVIKGISSLGTTVAVSSILIAQLLTAAMIDFFGLFGAQHQKFGLNEIIGLAIMIAGIVIFKLK